MLLCNLYRCCCLYTLDNDDHDQTKKNHIDYNDAESSYNTPTTSPSTTGSISMPHGVASEWGKTNSAFEDIPDDHVIT